MRPGRVLMDAVLALALRQSALVGDDAACQNSARSVLCLLELSSAPPRALYSLLKAA